MHCKAPFTRYNLLSNQLSNGFDNCLYRVYKHSTPGLTTGCIMYTAGCQTGCTTQFDNRLNEKWLFVQHGCQTGCQTGLTTGWMFIYTIQPVVQLVVLCKRGITTTLSNTPGHRHTLCVWSSNTAANATNPSCKHCTVEHQLQLSA